MTKFLKRVTDFFFSLRTTMWLLGVLIIIFFAGAFVMPAHREFEAIHSMPMFEWLSGLIHMSWTSP